MQVPFGFVSREIYAGPYRDKPSGLFGVKLAQEIPAPCDLSIPIRDFGIPSDDKIVRDVLRQVLNRLARREPVYVGCMGGLGRTGTFLALLVKTLGTTRPVEYVRSRYNTRAVETKAQEDYIAKFDTRPLAFDSLLAGGTALTIDTIRLFTRGVTV